MIGFANRYQALLQVARLLGVLDRMIKQRLRDASSDELFSHERALWKRAREIAQPDKAKTVSLGKMAEALANHPFNKLLTAERIRRIDDSDLGDIGKMTEQQIRDYLIHKSDRSSSKPKKSLPVLPKGIIK